MFAQLTSGWLCLLDPSSGLVNATAFLAIWVMLWLPIAIPRAIALKWYPPHPLPPQEKLSLLAPLYLLVPLILWGMTRLENRPISDYGIGLEPDIFLSLVKGIVLSIFTLVVGYGLQILGGALQWQRPNLQSSLPVLILSTLALSLWISGTEEAVFRGVLLTELAGEFSLVGAAIASSLIFALCHLIWDVSGTWKQLPGLLAMGLILAAARGVDGGNLGLAWGLHGGWIWGLITLESIPILAIKPDSNIPEWITGLDGQPLSGFVGFAILALTGLLLQM